MTITKYHYTLIICLVGFIFSLILAKPKVEEIENMLLAKNNLWEAISIKKNNITSNLEQYNPNSGEAKYVFRITIPLIMKIFDLTVKNMYILQWLLGIGIYFIWCKLFETFVHSRWLLLMLTLCLSTVYYGKAFNIDSGSSVNTLSYFLILLAVYWRNYIIPFVLTLILLFFNDERGAMAFSVIGLFNIFFENNSEEQVWNKKNIILIVTFLCCFVLRFMMTFMFNMKTPLGGVGFNIFAGQWKHLHLGFFSGLAGLTIAITICLIDEFKLRNYSYVILISFILIVFIVGSSIVSDITKSIAYLTPLFILSIYRLVKTGMNVNNIVTATLVIGILFPTIVIVGDKQFYYYSILFDIIFKISSFFT